ARDLLRKIRAEKTKLIAEKKIKAEKPLPLITDEEIPFDIPDSWCLCCLGDVCQMYTGDSIAESEKNAKYRGLADGFSYIGTKDISFDNKINYDNGVRIPFENTFRRAYKGSLLMCIEGGSAGRKIAVTDCDVCFGNKLCNFNSDKILNKYIYFYLQSPAFQKSFRDNVTGMIGGVSLRRLNSIPF
ncbi:restriction endonuclease subunit S, partial [Ralstonia pseudosolanacearum]|uniref:restriction endonuclease subunit S n=1 Tax=Ralstonia pseudosolanacearum TaxID=1310165 RepID=UPI003CE77DEB